MNVLYFSNEGYRKIQTTGGLCNSRTECFYSVSTLFTMKIIHVNSKRMFNHCVKNLSPLFSEIILLYKSENVIPVTSRTDT